MGGENLCEKNGVSPFYLKVLRLKMQHFHTKLPSYKPMLKQIEWEVQNGNLTKSGVLPLTALSFSKIFFGIRVDLMYQLPKCPYSYFL